MQSVDVWLFTVIHNLAGYSAPVDFLIVFVGQYLFYVVMLIFLYYLYRDYRGEIGNVYWYIVALVAAVIARFGVAEFIRFFIHRPRPFLALQLPHLLTDAAYSFPSGHTIFMFALATVVHMFDKKFGRFLYVSGFLIGMARVAGGVHYLSDILGGMILGILTGYIVYILWERFRRRTVHRIMSA